MLVLRVQKMDVAGGDNGLIQLPAQLQDGAVIILQYRLVLDPAVFHQKTVVADGLDLQIVVKLCDLFQLFFLRAVHHRAVQLAHAAGGADEQSLPVLQKQALGDGGAAVEVLEIGLGDHFIQVFQTRPVFHQQDHMVALGHVGAAQRVVHRLDIVHGAGPLLGQHGQELLHHPGHHHGVV